MAIYLINTDYAIITENKSYFNLSGISILLNFMTGICYETRNVMSPHVLKTFKVKSVERSLIPPRAILYHWPFLYGTSVVILLV